MSLEQLLVPGSRPAAQFERPQTGRVLRAGAGGLFVTLDRLGRDVEVGPVRYSRPAVHVHPTGSTNTGANLGTYPPAGTPVLVLFGETAGGELDPWAVAFDGWPA